MEPRFFARRFGIFCQRMYWRRLRNGIAEPEWTDIREDEFFRAITQENEF